MVQRTRKIVASWALVLVIGLGAAPAHANKHELTESGHPLRVVAYLLYPVGLLIDTVLFRPAHWLVNHQPLRTIFGHDIDEH